jgi:hypothetical protein
MHLIMVIVGGLMSLGVFLLFGQHWGGTPRDLVLAAKLFIPAWFILAVINMWIGVAKAGYSVREELPILLIVFAIPAVLAAVVIWRLAR